MKKITLLLMLGALAVGVPGSSWCVQSKRQENLDRLNKLYTETIKMQKDLSQNLQSQQRQRQSGYNWNVMFNSTQGFIEKINELTTILDTTAIFRNKGLLGRKKGFNKLAIDQACGLIGIFQKILGAYTASGLLNQQENLDINAAMVNLLQKARNISLGTKAEVVNFKGLNIGE